MTDRVTTAAKTWWESRWVVPALALLSTVPLWFTRMPPLIDLIGHLGRYHVQLELAHSAALQQNWEYNWALIGNLGVDLAIIPLAWLFGLEGAGWLVAAALPPLMIWGMFRAAKAVHGRVPATALAAASFALAYPYQYGFVNFWLGSALALHAFAFWAAMVDQRRIRSIVFVPVSVLIWVCHVYAWGILGILIGGYELGRTIDRSGTIGSAARAIGRCWSILCPLLLMSIWRAEGAGAETLGWFRLDQKLVAFSFTLRDEWAPLDLASLGAALLLLYFGLRDSRLTYERRLGIPALLCVATFIVLPFQLFGSAFADMRVAPFFFITALLALRPRDWPATSRSLSSTIAAVAGCVFVLRIGAAAIGYAEYGAAYERHFAAVDYVAPGSRVAILTPVPCAVPWRRPRLDHLGSIMLIRRDAFVNSQWDVPGAQLLKPKGALGTAFNSDPSQFVRSDTCPTEEALLRGLGERIAALPNGVFDYLWITDVEPGRLPSYPGMERIFADDRTALYRIARSPSQTPLT